METPMAIGFILSSTKIDLKLEKTFNDIDFILLIKNIII